MVYVISQNGKPLMPTNHHGKVKWLLRRGKAKVVRRVPFTIQLTYQAGEERTQEVSLGVDAGSKVIGLSATTEKKVLYEEECSIRQDIVTLMNDRRAFRRARRNRTTRYRAPRFDNRVHSKNKGWLAPSVENKIGSHVRRIQLVCSILPVSSITVEVADFDIKKILNPEIEGIGYQHGPQLGYENVKMYVKARDHYQCCSCKGKSKDNRLEVHHIQQRKDGGSNRPDNLITLCHTCHKKYHEGKINLDKIKPTSFRDAAFMNIMKWTAYRRMKEIYGDKLFLTFGYKTKYLRDKYNLPKAHHVDARCISGNPTSEVNNEVYVSRKLRCNNRQLHKAKIEKGGYRKNNKALHKIFGYRLFDIVSYKDQICYIHGRRIRGAFDVRTFQGKQISSGASVRKLIPVAHTGSYFIYKEKPIHLHPVEDGVPSASI